MDSAQIRDHYQQSQLTESIRAALQEAGKDIESLTIADLAAVDEFHVGGRPATVRLCALLDITSDDRVLDLGCGIGGLSRYIAATFGAQVTGVDITPAYVETAADLTSWVGLSDHVEYIERSVLDLGLPDASFDTATQLHVGMNIDDKEALFREVARVVRPGGRYGIYDILSTEAGSEEASCEFPVPWASEQSFSHVADVGTYLKGLDAAGFDIIEVNNRAPAARPRSRRTEGEPAQLPPLGLQLLMGADFAKKVANMAAAIAAGRLAPTEIIAVKR